MANIASPTLAFAAMMGAVQTRFRCVVTLNTSCVSTALTKHGSTVQALILKSFSLRCAQTADAVGLTPNIRPVVAIARNQLLQGFSQITPRYRLTPSSQSTSLANERP